MAPKEKPQKAASPVDVTEFIRLTRVQVKDSNFAAYQIEKVAVAGDKVVSRGFIGHADVLEMTLAKVQDALDPERIVDSKPVSPAAVA